MRPAISRRERTHPCGLWGLDWTADDRCPVGDPRAGFRRDAGAPANSSAQPGADHRQGCLCHTGRSVSVEGCKAVRVPGIFLAWPYSLTALQSHSLSAFKDGNFPIPEREKFASPGCSLGRAQRGRGETLGCGQTPGKISASSGSTA